ncbi:MAG: hypothetical protein I8H75_04540 [Myxococcaceae bacterium]|nr:hypothetical protein [Myxococcaceae bacterium]MBH2006591.1 hypothetical protein [Myxococcaceae bacterium]
MKTGKIFASVISIVLLWFFMDFVLHGILLDSLYKESASVWRPMEEMSHAAGFAVSVIQALFFVLFNLAVSKVQNWRSGLRMGLGIGVIVGVCMANFYLYLPIPIALALGWMFGNAIEYGFAGILVGFWEARCSK